MKKNEDEVYRFLDDGVIPSKEDIQEMLFFLEQENKPIIYDYS